MTTSSTEIPISEIRLNGGTQLRAEIDQDVVDDYSEIIDELPPVILFDDGKFKWLADGFHRLKGAIFAGRDGIKCEIRNGSRRDAILFAAGANARHGLRRSNADKRKAVKALLTDREWARWSNHEIGRQCAVSPGFVAAVRRELEGPKANPNPAPRLASRGGSVFPMSVRKSAPSQHTSSGNGHATGSMRCPFCRKLIRSERIRPA